MQDAWDFLSCRVCCRPLEAAVAAGIVLVQGYAAWQMSSSLQRKGCFDRELGELEALAGVSTLHLAEFTIV